MTNEERIQAIEWLKRRPVMMAGAKRMYDLAVEALEAYVPDMNVGDMISRQATLDALNEQIEQCNKALGSFDISLKDEFAIKVERASLEAYKEQLENLPSVQPKGTKLSTVCLLCKKPAVTFNTEDDIPYTNYSYCEDCLRKGLKLLKKQIKVLPTVQPNHNADPDKKVDDCISRQEAIDAVLNVIPHDEYWAEQVEKAIRSLPPVQQEITHEQAVDYLHKTGWLQNHDRILTESKVPLKGIWKDFTDEGYVECPFCKSATNCESKEEIDDLHFCFSCGAMLKRGKAE